MREKIDNLPTLLTPAEVARLFRVDPKTVTRWSNSGKLPSIRTMGGHRRYRLDDVLPHIRSFLPDDQPCPVHSPSTHLSQFMVAMGVERDKPVIEV